MTIVTHHKSNPIIFDAESILAIFNNQKTQTRRIAHQEPLGDTPRHCPYGTTHDTLWVKETWQEQNNQYRYKSVPYTFTNYPRKWRSPTHMPKKASRITLEITDVRLEHLQNITLNGAIAEGYPKAKRGLSSNTLDALAEFRTWFRKHWNKLHKKHPWDTNPLVWVITFKTLEFRMGPYPMNERVSHE